MAINLTGQLTIGDASNIGNSVNYIKLDINRKVIISSGAFGDTSQAEVLIVKPGIWKSKPSYNSGKPAIQYFGSQVTNEIKHQYIIDANGIAASPAANFNSLSGHTLDDKFLFWINQQILALIIADNPTFSGTIVDINL